MRARVAPTKYDTQRANERCWETICEAQASSNALMLIAVKRHFGLGPKRIKELVSTFETVKKEFDEYDSDGVFQDKISEELLDVGVDITEAWDVPQSFEEVRRDCRNKNKPVINVGEARGIREAFDGFKWLMEHSV